MTWFRRPGPLEEPGRPAWRPPLTDAGSGQAQGRLDLDHVAQTIAQDRSAEQRCEMLHAHCQQRSSFLAIGCCRSGDVYGRHLCPAHLRESLDGTASGWFCCALCGHRDLDIVTVIPLNGTDPVGTPEGGQL